MSVACGGQQAAQARLHDATDVGRERVGHVDRGLSNLKKIEMYYVAQLRLTYLLTRTGIAHRGGRGKSPWHRVAPNTAACEASPNGARSPYCASVARGPSGTPCSA